MLKIREIQKTDLPLIRKWRNHDRKWFYDQAIITEEMQNKWYEKYIADDSDILFIAEAGDGNPIGMYGLTNIDHDMKTAEAGRLLIGEKQYTGMGLGVDMMRSVLEFAFKELSLNEVHADVQAVNPRAIIVHVKAGYRIVGFQSDWMGNRVCFSIHQHLRIGAS
ncbi:hypothetical protein LCGC14_2600260 [marine sediment metagenome]|uniref:N-acetyltransferase domain-containing protein n=1 Tax=marine sediment metagenome TaxID=412755 RepID=A0A0F9A8X4_9ZZZZ